MSGVVRRGIGKTRLLELVADELKGTEADGVHRDLGDPKPFPDLRPSHRLHLAVDRYSTYIRKTIMAWRAPP